MQIENLESRQLFSSAAVLIPQPTQTVYADHPGIFRLGTVRAPASYGSFGVGINWGFDDTTGGGYQQSRRGALRPLKHTFMPYFPNASYVVGVFITFSNGVLIQGHFDVKVLPPTGAIVGRVFAAETGRRAIALSGVTFNIEDVTNPGQSTSAVSDAKGIYRVTGLYPGTYTISETDDLNAGVVTDSSVTHQIAKLVVGFHTVLARTYRIQYPAAMVSPGINLTTVTLLGPSAQSAVTALAVDSVGEIYAGTGTTVSYEAPQFVQGETDFYTTGTLFKIGADSNKVWSVSTGFIPNNIEIAPNGTVFGIGDYSDFTFPNEDVRGTSLKAVASDGTQITDGGFLIDAGDYDFYTADYPQPVSFDASGDAYYGAGYTDYSNVLETPGEVLDISAGSSNAKLIATFNGTSLPTGIPQVRCVGANGDIYGNIYSATGATDNGNIFEIAAATDAVSFRSQLSGIDTMNVDPSGNLYITAGGTIYELPAGSSTMKQLASYNTSSSGQIQFDPQGNAFILFPKGGPAGDGMIVRVDAKSHAVTTVASFNASTGSAPDSMFIDSAGNIFGCTSVGGAYNGGTVFKVPAGSGTINTLVSFAPGSGINPSMLVEDARGNLYGATTSDGPLGMQAYGTIFKISRTT